ncbi:MAG: MotA/TolQ/ExbB proton channel family protein [Methylococcales bacterium]
MSETNIVMATLYVLGGFSVLTWSVILLKIGEVVLSDVRNHFFVRNLKSGKELALNDPANIRAPAGRVWQAGHAKLMKAGELSGLNSSRHEAWYELTERAMRQQIQKEKTRLDSGLGWLASIGSTAPFVGLFGTVWGILHALKDISAQGSASLEVVAGPIGEALIATAVGIGVAIPAVIAYNCFLKQSRRIVAILEHVANDFLHSTIENQLTRTEMIEHGRTITE